ncbi:uncharacterized protein F4822DRAFT_9121 [Hypoxylon trugodes]|uniref:uncharacterized protein n=1 Tax=Hypoxylon trugodes TaxID=326681 RepID=UPI00219CE18C|nr:uncharacterized protein F4822DRAFT_9121 [Hypoxylon trugodes]KAI1393340.1 hypothetical protein F4822DRAFT_9121 [Hypoxylon trugodes]
MGIHKDARNGTLTGDRLSRYLKENPNILTEQDPDTGLTPLAEATVGGFAEEVQLLLGNGARADGLCKNDETPLLLAAWKTETNRARIIQLLLPRLTSESVDKTCPAARNYTALMFAIEKEDLDSIRLLRNAGASLTVKNDDGLTGEDMATDAEARSVIRAFNPSEEQSAYAKLAFNIISILLFIVAWANKALDGVVQKIYKLNPDLRYETEINKAVNGSETPSKAKFVENIGKFTKENRTLERFFKGKEGYIKELAQKVVDLEKDPSTDLGSKDLLPKTIKVSLHQQVIYCDDSSSMKREGRWDSLKKLVERISRITTRVLPEGEGVALRFINQDVDNSSNLTVDGILGIIGPMSWKPNGDTAVGTFLRSKILEPLVYSKLESNSLERPLLVSVITDGMPSDEGETEFVDTIADCGDRLEKAGYPRDSVKFMVGQIGTGKQAAKFLDAIRNKADISSVVYCTTDQLDAKFAEFRENERSLDRWVSVTFNPISYVAAYLLLIHTY